MYSNVYVYIVRKVRDERLELPSTVSLPFQQALLKLAGMKIVNCVMIHAAICMLDRRMHRLVS